MGMAIEIFRALTRQLADRCTSRALPPAAAVLTLIILAAPAGSALGATHTSVERCGTLVAGPGAIVRGSRGGPLCLLRAFESGCRRAAYTLSVFGVDTTRTNRFDVVRGRRDCRIDVTSSFRIVPQPARTHRGRCADLRREGTRVVATGCAGSGLPRVISLSPPGRGG